MHMGCHAYRQSRNGLVDQGKSGCGGCCHGPGVGSSMCRDESSRTGAGTIIVSYKEVWWLMEQERAHHYATTITWTGNTGAGTADYRSYRRDHLIESAGKPPLPGSSDPAFRGDPARYNPEELLVASLSACHMLWYLHLCAVNGIVVTAYDDRAAGVMHERTDGSGYFTEVTLAPRVEITPESDRERAMALHDDAHRLCFVASSVNFPVRHRPEIVVISQNTSEAHAT